jgi:hypothetical protein
MKIVVALSVIILNVLLFSQTATALGISSITDNRASYVNSQIPRYDKFEITFQVNQVTATNLQFPYLSAAEANQYLSQFVNQGISVQASFLPPGQTNWALAYNQPAFYYQDFQTSTTNATYQYPLDSYSWKVRFAPNQVGEWRYKVSAIDAGGQTDSAEFTFSVTTSDNKGFIRVSPSDPRYFEYEDGTYFPGLGFNAGFARLESTAYMQQLKDNNINLLRAWMTPLSIYGNSWTSWQMMPVKYGGYLPLAPVNTYQENTSEPRQFMYFVAEGSNWFEECAFLGHSQPSPSLKPNTNYYIKARYKGNNITGPRLAGVNQYGFVVKVGGWQATCRDPYNPATDPAFAQTVPITNYGVDSSWNTIQGVWNSGNASRLPYLYMALENASSGAVYIESIEMKEMTGGTVANPTLTGANILDKPYPNELTYYAQRPSFKIDQIIENLKHYNIYLKTVILEKEDPLSIRLDAYGNPSTSDHADNFYGAPANCTSCRTQTAQRWLQESWFRYIQARWGYSTQIHSFELVNEGNPVHNGHFALTDEMGKFFRCRAFGISVPYTDSTACTYTHPNAHLTSTSTWHSFPVNPFWVNAKYPNVSYADYHAYVSTGWLRNSVYESDSALYHYDYSTNTLGALNTAAATAGTVTKPIIRGEAGLDPLTVQDQNALGVNRDTQGIWHHNYLWAQLNAGATIESYWWVNEHINYRYNNTDIDHKPQYKIFSNFSKRYTLEQWPLPECGGYVIQY